VISADLSYQHWTDAVTSSVMVSFCGRFGTCGERRHSPHIAHQVESDFYIVGLIHLSIICGITLVPTNL
jgi:hypothetical protein